MQKPSEHTELLTVYNYLNSRKTEKHNNLTRTSTSVQTVNNTLK